MKIHSFEEGKTGFFIHSKRPTEIKVSCVLLDRSSSGFTDFGSMMMIVVTCQNFRKYRKGKTDGKTRPE